MSSSATPFRLRPAALTVALVMSGALLLGAPTAWADPTEVPDVPVPTEVSTADDYIVTLADAPIAAYDGDVSGYDATQPTGGDSVDTDSPDAKRYRSYLHKRQDRAAARVGSEPDERFEVGVNAFTTSMTGRQATVLSRTAGVVSVTKNRLRKVPDDRKSVDFLGLSGQHGVWSELGGADEAGRGVVVGVIDSGIWPESDSFAGEPLRTSGKKGSRDPYQPRRSGKTITMNKSDGGTFTGTCQTGENFTVADCSSKLVGARYFGDAWLAAVPAGQRKDFVSPRDGEGHGSHTASIAAGNVGVRASVDGQNFGRISGVAPAAKIASYKVLWQAKDATESGAYDADLLAAIDAAISDGVDVINYSITAADDPTDPIQLAFRGAASAGIFVAASAGNSGPDASTVQSTSPWVTTVGAHSIAPYYGTVTLGNGQAYAGISSSVDRRVGSAPLVNASSVALAGQTPANATACAAGSLDPAQTAGKIVVCDRGVVDRVVKSAEVDRAGGVGMVLANLTPDTLDADRHSVPTVHVDPPASIEIKAYAATAGATARLTKGNQSDSTISYPQIATFSGRGPSLGTNGDTLKPDLVAPGVSILGAVAPPSNNSEDFGFLSGTSQSAPQVAGLAALWLGDGVRPRWSPMRIKSALMTTAADVVDEDGAPVTDPFVQGAGRVVPERMFSPGLVFPAGDADWSAYLEGLGMDTGTGIDARDPSDYNSASISIGKLAGTQTVTRRVTAVQAGRYRATAGIPGVRVAVSPSVLDLAKGETKTFKVTFTRTSAAFDAAADGFLTWQGGRTTVRVPLVVTPIELDAPTQVIGTGPTDSVDYRVTPGTSGTFTATASGLRTGTSRAGSLVPGRNVQYAVTVPAGTKAARFTSRTTTPGAALDLYVYRVVNGAAVLVAEAVTASANESVVLANPAAGTYVAAVDNVGTGTTATALTFRASLVPAGAGLGGFAVTPTSTQATAGRPSELTASWSGLDATTPYVGWIEYPNGTGTVVSVN